MQRWEYCLLTGVKIDSIGSFEGVYPRLYFFSKRGIEKTVDLRKGNAKNRPPGFEKVTEGGYIAHTIASLGADGWEMVGSGIQPPSIAGGIAEAHYLYFRRLLE